MVGVALFSTVHVSVFVVGQTTHKKITPPENNYRRFRVQSVAIAANTMASSQPSDETEPEKKSSTIRRSDSESSFVSVPEDGPVKDYRDYRVRKSGLIA